MFPPIGFVISLHTSTSIFKKEAFCSFYYKQKHPALWERGVSALIRLRLFTQAELCNNCFVAFKVGTLKVFEEALTLTYHLDQAATSHKVMFIGFKMLCYLFDTSRQDGHLCLWATDILLADLSQSNRLLLVFFSNHPAIVPCGARWGKPRLTWPRPGQPALLAPSHAVVDKQGNQATTSDDQHDNPHGQPDETAWVKRTLVLALLLVLLRRNAVIIVAA